MLSREKQGFLYVGGFLEPIAPLWLPCGALLTDAGLQRRASCALPPPPPGRKNEARDAALLRSRPPRPGGRG